MKKNLLVGTYLMKQTKLFLNSREGDTNLIPTLHIIPSCYLEIAEKLTWQGGCYLVSDVLVMTSQKVQCSHVPAVHFFFDKISKG